MPSKKGEEPRGGHTKSDNLEGYKKFTQIKKRGQLYDYYYNPSLPKGDPSAVRLVEAKP